MSLRHSILILSQSLLLQQSVVDMSLRHSILILSQSLLLQQSTGRHVTQTQYSDSEPVFTLTTVHR